MSFVFTENQIVQIIKSYNGLLEVCDYIFNQASKFRGLSLTEDPETKNYNNYITKFFRNPKLLDDARALKIFEFYNTKRPYFLGVLAYSDKWINVDSAVHILGSEKVSFRLNFSTAYRRAIEHSKFVIDKPGTIQEKEKDICLPENLLIELVNVFIKCEFVYASNVRDEQKDECAKLMKRLIEYSKELDRSKKEKYNEILSKYSIPEKGEDHVDSLFDGFVGEQLKKIVPGMNTGEFKRQFQDARKNNPTFKMLMDTYGNVTSGKVTGAKGLVEVIDKVGDIFHTAKEEVVKIAQAEVDADNENLINNTNEVKQEEVVVVEEKETKEEIVVVEKQE